MTYKSLFYSFKLTYSRILLFLTPFDHLSYGNHTLDAVLYTRYRSAAARTLEICVPTCCSSRKCPPKHAQSSPVSSARSRINGVLSNQSVVSIVS